jgi:DnaK suppressor protein
MESREQNMTKAELKTFRQVLESRQAELGIGNREALAVEASPDEMDRIQHFSEREYAMNHLERNSNRLREVRAALARMDAGAFGVCVDCDEEINPKRLLAVPWASTCITCQEIAEKSPTDSSIELDTSDIVAAA